MRLGLPAACLINAGVTRQQGDCGCMSTAPAKLHSPSSGYFDLNFRSQSYALRSKRVTARRRRLEKRQRHSHMSISDGDSEELLVSSSDASIAILPAGRDWRLHKLNVKVRAKEGEGGAHHGRRGYQGRLCNHDRQRLRRGRRDHRRSGLR